jgi:hypothetical protein
VQRQELLLFQVANHQPSFAPFLFPSLACVFSPLFCRRLCSPGPDDFHKVYKFACEYHDVVQRKGVQDYIRVCHNSRRRTFSGDDLGLMEGKVRECESE